MSLGTFKECVWKSDCVCIQVCLINTLTSLSAQSHHTQSPHWLLTHTSTSCGPLMQFNFCELSQLFIIFVICFVALFKRDFFFLSFLPTCPCLAFHSVALCSCELRVLFLKSGAYPHLFYYLQSLLFHSQQPQRFCPFCYSTSSTNPHPVSVDSFFFFFVLGCPWTTRWAEKERQGDRNKKIRQQCEKSGRESGVTAVTSVYRSFTTLEEVEVVCGR